VFNAIIPLAQPIIAVQVDAAQLPDPAGAELLAKLEAYFMKPVVLVAWDQDSRFCSRGFPCPESALTDEDLHWRKFELPPEPEVPF
jgi:hypothetical protein